MPSHFASFGFSGTKNSFVSCSRPVSSPGGVPVRRGQSSGLAPSFRSGRASVDGSGCVCVDPGPSFNTQRDFVPTHAFRPVAAGGSPAGAWPEQHRRRTKNLALAGRCRSPRLRSWEGRRSPAGTCVSPHHAPCACSLSSTLPPL